MLILTVPRSLSWCSEPASEKVGAQLSASGLRWKAYQPSTPELIRKRNSCLANFRGDIAQLGCQGSTYVISSTKRTSRLRDRLCIEEMLFAIDSIQKNEETACSIGGDM